jgi:hypothetical protein
MHEAAREGYWPVSAPWAGRPTSAVRVFWAARPLPPGAGRTLCSAYEIAFTKALTFAMAIIGSAVFTFAYLASTSSLPPCSDTAAILSSDH